jgi:hypothetical protein
VPDSQTWDIGGPDVLEYGDMMRVYAEVAGLYKRRMIVLPFLTPTIASLWVGAVTPIPSALARPLVESLECDAVMRNHDIDSIIKRPPGGLTSYRRAVAVALNRADQGLPDATWQSLDSEPGEPLPSDPDWAGEIIYTDVQTAATAATPDDVWNAVESAANGGRWYSFPIAPRRHRPGLRWRRVVESEPGAILRLQAQVRSPGRAWLEVTVTPQLRGGSRYTQRALLYPRGLAGRVYWFVLRPLHFAALRALARNVADAATRRTSVEAPAP